MINDLNTLHLSTDHMPTYSFDFRFVKMFLFAATASANKVSEAVRTGL